MRVVPTSPARANELKREAKRLQRKGSHTHVEALEVIAQQEGYDHWHHVIKCVNATQERQALLGTKEMEAITANDVKHLTDGAGFPFAAQADATGLFTREPDAALRAEVHQHIASLCISMGIYSKDALWSVLGETTEWSGQYLQTLAHAVRATGSVKWRSETEFLTLLMLIAARPNVVTKGMLMDIGWSKDLAMTTLDTARTFHNKRI